MEIKKTVDLIDFILYLSRKWKNILIWMLIFALLMSGYSGIKSYKDMVSSQHQANLNNGETMSEVAAILGDEDRKKVEDAGELYTSYRNTYDYTLSYYNNSIKMQMNPNKVPKEEMQYYIEPTDKKSTVINVLSKMIYSQETCEKIKEKLGIEGDVSELISIDEKEKNKEISHAEISVKTEESTNDLLIRVIAPERQMCEEIADILEEEIDVKTKEIKENVGDFFLNYVGRNYSENSDSSLLSEQQECLNDLADLKEDMNAVTSNFTESQKKYFDELIKAEEGQQEEASELQNQITVNYISVKHILLGLFVGLFLSCCWYLILYILDNHLLTVQQLEDGCNLYIIDTLTIGPNPEKKKCMIDRCINKIFQVEPDADKENKIKMICANIQMIAQKQNMESVHITSVAASPEVTEIKQAILNQADQNGFVVSTGNSVISDQKSLKCLSDSDGVVLVERVKDSVLKDIEKEIQICQNHGVPILGVVAIR